MTDTITTPISPDAPPPEAPLAPIESAEVALPDLMARNLDGAEPIAFEDLRQVIKRKEPEITDLHSKPITPLRYLEKGEKSLKQVAADTQKYHDVERGKELLGASADQFDAETTQELGRLLNPETKPPDQIKLKVGDVEILPLRDRDPVTELEAIRSPREAAEYMGNWRQARAEEAQRIQDELAREQQAAVERQEAHQQQQVRVDQEQQAAQRAAEERAQAEAAQRQAAATQQFNQLSRAEQDAVVHQQRLDNWVRQNYPDVHPSRMDDPAVLAHLQQRDPARFQQLLQAAEQYHQAEAVRQNAGQQRQAHQIVAAQHQQAQLDAWGSQQDAAFERALAQKMPYYAKGAARTDLSRAAKEYLEEIGVTKQQADALWKNGTLRSLPAQLMLADAAARKLEQSRVKELASKRVAAPPVQRPGVARAPSGDLDSVRNLENRMANTKSERESLRLSVALSKARRAAGMQESF
jgi:hypothetical protein